MQMKFLKKALYHFKSTRSYYHFNYPFRELKNLILMVHIEGLQEKIAGYEKLTNIPNRDLPKLNGKNEAYFIEKNRKIMSEFLKNIKEIYFHEKYQMWWPKFDHKPDGNYHMVMSGINAIDILLKHCKKFDLCIQAGGHLGYWPIKLAGHFKKVLTFEADPIVFECLKKNTINISNIDCNNIALGAAENEINMRRGSSAGSTKFWEDGNIIASQMKIDSFHAECDAILLDIEGMEVNALKGAKYTIKRYAPVILVEELPRNHDELYNYMKEIDYKRVDGCGKDGIWIKK